jgi:RNA polymerase sigma factor (sigma-70 family)
MATLGPATASFENFCENVVTNGRLNREPFERTTPASTQTSLTMQTNGKLRRVERPLQSSKLQCIETLNVVPGQSQKEFLLAALDHYERPLTAYALRLQGGDLHAARDAVQHTYMQLCQQTPATVGHKLAPWLYTVCRNRVLDELKSKSSNSTAMPEKFDTVDVNAPDPANQFEQDEILQVLRQLFDCLPQPEREVIELWSHGFDAKEIADILEKNQGTVRVNLHRAIKRLKQHPNISIWLERATGQIVRPDVAQSLPGPASNCDESSTPSIKGERS